MPRTKKTGGGANARAGSFGRDATIDDLPQDDLDAFEAGRDSILLDGGDTERRADDLDELGGRYDREVLRVDDAAQHADSDHDEEGVDLDQEGEEEVKHGLGSSKAAATARQGRKRPIAPVDSDDDDGESDDDEDDADDDEVHINDRGWGSNKRSYYNTNNLDDIESDSDMDEEQARELELKEVKRLQRKSRSAMDDADFGLGDDEVEGGLGKALRDAGREERRKELDGEDDAGPSAKQVLAAAPTAAPATLSSDKATRQALLAKLQIVSPETVALAGEYADVVEEFSKVDTTLKKLLAEKPNHPGVELIHLHHQTLVTYLTTITFYFHLRASPECAANPAKLTSHPVLTRLMKLKQGLSVMEELGLTADIEPGFKSRSGKVDDRDAEVPASSELGDDDEDELGSLEGSELDGLLEDEKENAAPLRSSSARVGKKKAGKTKASPSDNATASMNGTKAKTEKGEKKSKKSKRAEPAPLAAGLADLDDEPMPEFKIKANKKGKSGAPNPFALSQNSGDAEAYAEASSSFGDPTQLADFESAERDAKRRSLQFHASAVETKGSQRSKAARDKLSGDMDIPYRDRERSRMAVEAAKAARQQREQQSVKDSSLDGEGWGEGDDRDWRDVMGVDDGAGDSGGEGGGDGDGDQEGYYDLVASGKRAAKKAKRDEYEAMRDEERFVAEETLEEGQHRGINRAIEKNKGLAPKRKKVARNPRVKKRQKYEEAKKKLSSRQAVFKGGQASLQGGYGGEQSGISSHLVRSRKLG